jgi:cephalosporin hydroxylase
MGKDGKPGASLRAFRDYLENINVYGADFDKRILFEENRIKTFYVDQTDPKTFLNLSKKIDSDFDLMIDDGLHSPNANLNSLAFFKNKIKKGGYIVIEDVNPKTEKLWITVSNLTEKEFKSAFIKTKSACVFILQKK